MVLQRVYIFVLNKIFSITERIPEQRRDRLAFICFLIMMCVFALRITAVFDSNVPVKESTWGVIFVLLLGGVIVFSIKSPLAEIRWSKPFAIVFFACGIWLFFTCFLHYIGDGYRLLAIFIIVVYPCFYFVWNNRGDYEKIFSLISWAATLVGVVYIIINLAVTPFYDAAMDGGKYYGLMHNPNSAGLWGASVLIGALYLVMTVQKNKLWFAWLSVILSIVFIAVSESRTALLCACGQIFFCVIIFLKRKINSRESHRFNWTVFRRVITFALIFVVCLIVVGALTLFQNENLIPVIDHISSGRVDIWENFLGKINMWGHDFRADPTYVRIGSHNNVIDILYRNGAVAGILYLLLEIAALVRIIRCCLRKGTVPLYMYFVCSATIAFVLVSLFETVMQPTHWTMTMLFFLALAPGFQAFNQIDSPK